MYIASFEQPNLSSLNFSIRSSFQHFQTMKERAIYCQRREKFNIFTFHDTQRQRQLFVRSDFLPVSLSTVFVLPCTSYSSRYVANFEFSSRIPTISLIRQHKSRATAFLVFTWHSIRNVARCISVNS